MPPQKKGKRQRSQEKPTPVPPTTHSVALATIRDATVAFGAEYGALMVPVERRITQYLRQQRLFVVGGRNSVSGVLRTCYSLDVVAGVWVEETPMNEGRYDFGMCVLRGDLWAVGGLGRNEGSALRSCVRLDMATHTWVRGPDMTTARWWVGVGVINGEVWALGGIDSAYNRLSSCERLDAVTGTWIAGPDMAKPHKGHRVVVLRGELWVVAEDCRTTEHLDAATNRWVRGPDHRLTRHSFAVTVYRGQLWAAGGVERGVLYLPRCCLQHMDGGTLYEQSPSLAQPCCA